MNIAVLGGAGMLGKRVVEQLRARDHTVKVLSRHSSEHPVDLTTGDGLSDALIGCDVVVDASNDTSRHADRALVQGSRRLLIAEKAAGVRHHVCVSIVGCDRVPVGYYGVKLAQEGIVEGEKIPWSIVRSTQFHEFAVRLFAAAARWYVLPIPRARVQTVAVGETAHAIADVCEQPPCLRRINVAGPEILAARELALAWKTHSGHRAVLIEIPLPGKLGRALREGALTCERPDIRGKLGFRDWLAAGPGSDLLS
jgi:uncharacterized protein YbjT (DUF2867 family)